MTPKERMFCWTFAAVAMFVGLPAVRAGFCTICGSNSATVGDGVVFDELHVRGFARPEHPISLDRIYRSVERNPVPRRPGAPGSKDLQEPGPGKGAIRNALAPVKATIQENVGLQVRGHDASVTSGSMLGVTFALQHPDGRAYDVLVTKDCNVNEQIKGTCEPLTFEVEPKHNVPYYELKVRKRLMKGGKTAGTVAPDDRLPDQGFDSFLCRGEHDDNKWIDKTAYKHAAFFFEGDRYTANKKVESLEKGSGWFNLACMGSAVAKMHLLRMTNAGTLPPTRVSSIAERTAVLKMITADYCGDGKGWTADGTPLLFADTHRDRWFAPRGFPVATPHPALIEAMWGPNGALCMGTPRRKATTARDCNCKPPGVQAWEVRKTCPSRNLKPCDEAWLDKWKAHDPGINAISVNVTTALPAYCDAPLEEWGCRRDAPTE